MNYLKRGRLGAKKKRSTRQRQIGIAFICMLSLLASESLIAQQFEETIEKEIGLDAGIDKSTLIVQNVNGPIQVEAYSGNKILLVVKKVVKASKQENLEIGKQEIDVKIEKRDSRVFIYLDSPWTNYDFEKERYSHKENYNGDYNPKYSYYLAFDIKVPRSLNLKLGTMNDGDIYVKDVQPQEVVVNNLNGAITLDNISGKTDVNALNKDINITYNGKPSGDSKYNSLNGDINITVKESLNADVTFKSMNGDFYTNFDTVKLSPQTSSKKTKNGKGIKYKLDTKEAFRIGSGGTKLDFNLLNGDVTVKKI